MAIFLLTQSYWSTKDDIQNDACLIWLWFYWDPWGMWHPWTAKQDRQHSVCIYICIYNMYCTHFTGNTSAVHSHISITCSNSMRIFLGWGQITEVFKPCRELWVNQQESYTPESRVETAVCCVLTLWEGGRLGVEKAEQALSSGERHGSGIVHRIIKGFRLERTLRTI